MQRARWVVFAVGALLGACAGTPSHHHASSYDPDNDDFDANKVDTVTQWAQTHGATVVWVNYPTKHRPRELGTAPSNPNAR